MLQLRNLHFRPDSSYTSRGGRSVTDDGEVYTIVGGGETSYGGSWRTDLFLDEGHYEFSSRVRSIGVAGAKGTRGVMLRISGETKLDSFDPSAEWKTLTYSFDVRGLEQIELVHTTVTKVGNTTWTSWSTMTATHHTAIVASVSGNTITVYQQNVTNSGHPPKVVQVGTLNLNDMKQGTLWVYRPVAR